MLAHALEKILLAQEVVLASVLFPPPARSGGRGHRHLEVATAIDERLDQRAFAGPRWPCDDEKPGTWRQRRSRPTSSARWRSLRPPTVFDWLMRHWFRNRAAFTRPNFGTAMSMSKTLAVST
jgi:hypothetical protein